MLTNLVYDEEALAKHIKPETSGYLQAVYALAAVPDFSHDAIETVFKEVCAELGIKMGQIGPAVRIALSGGTVSPSIYEVMEVLGQRRDLSSSGACHRPFYSRAGVEIG